MDNILSVDIGTGGCRAVLFSPTGAVITQSQKHYKTTYSIDGFAEQAPDEIYRKTLSIIQRCLLDRDDCTTTLVLGSVLHSILLLDKDHQPLTALSIWTNTRSRSLCQRLSAIYHSESWYTKTGCLLAPTYPLYRLLWFKENQPEIYRSFSVAVSIKAYIILRLFGILLEDHALASGTGLFNINKLTWDKSILDHIGLEELRLPAIVPVEHELYNLTEKSISSSINKCIIGSADGPLSHLGSAGEDPECGSLTVGTSAAVRIFTDTPLENPDSESWCYIFNKNFYVQGIATNNGGNVLEWFMKKVTGSELMPDAINEILEGPEFEHELLFAPFVFGERSVEHHILSSYKFQGLKPDHNFKDLLRAVVEGITFNIAFLFQRLNSRQSIRKVVLSGGFAEFEFVKNILATILPITLIDSSDIQPALYGGFLFATENSQRKIKKPPERILKSSGHREIYLKKFSRWQKNFIRQYYRKE